MAQTGAIVIRQSGALGINALGPALVFGGGPCPACCGGGQEIVCVCGPVVLDPPSGGPCGVGQGTAHPLTLTGTLQFGGSYSASGPSMTVPQTTLDLAHTSLLVPAEEGQEPCGRNVERTWPIACVIDQGTGNGPFVQNRDAVVQHVAQLGTSVSERSLSAWWRSSGAVVAGLGSELLSVSIPLAIGGSPTGATVRGLTPMEPTTTVRATAQWDGFSFTPQQLRAQGWTVASTVTGSVERTVLGCTLSLRVRSTWNVRLTQPGIVSVNTGDLDATVAVQLGACAGARPGESLRQLVERLQRGGEP